MILFALAHPAIFVVLRDGSKARVGIIRLAWVGMDELQEPPNCNRPLQRRRNVLAPVLAEENIAETAIAFAPTPQL